MSQTKRLANVEFVGFYQAILTDYLTIYPTDRLDVMRDNKRIAQELRFRGLAFFTLDLPEMGKVLDQSLSLGRLVDHSVPCFGARWKNSPIPKLFSGLWMRLFERSGLLRENIDPDVIFFLRTLLYTSKKLNLDCKPQRVYDAVKEYFDVDSKLQVGSSQLWCEPFGVQTSESLARFTDLCSSFTERRISEPYFDYHDGEQSEGRLPVLGDVARDEVLSHVQRCAGVLGVSLGLFEPESVLGRHGPGAVSEQLVGRTKYVFPSWSARLEAFFPWDYHGVTTVDNFLQDCLPIPELVPLNEESASKLCAVPKSQKGPRLIAAEPVCNQWIQQGLASILRERVASSALGACIDFFDQEPSRQGALAASRHGVRSTIDLSSASDRLSCWLVEATFRSNLSFLNLAAACRTRYLKNPIDKKQPGLLNLRKFASMGSALTFPVQSVVFAILAIGVGKSLNPKTSIRKLASEVRVFGDDIILPNSWVDTYVALLELVGLKINLSKTFTEGNFRESCGMDAYAGYDVTPPYIRWPSAEPVSRSAVGYVACVNNFFIKGLWHTSAFLEETAGWMRKLPVLNHRAAALGKATFCRGLDPRIRTRWDKDTQQNVVEVFRVKRRTPPPYLAENPNGFMEYSVASRGNTYTWRSILHPKDHFLTIGELAVQPPDGAPVLIRRSWIPTIDLSSFVDTE